MAPHRHRFEVGVESGSPCDFESCLREGARDLELVDLGFNGLEASIGSSQVVVGTSESGHVGADPPMLGMDDGAIGGLISRCGSGEKVAEPSRHGLNWPRRMGVGGGIETGDSRGVGGTSG